MATKVVTIHALAIQLNVMEKEQEETGGGAANVDMRCARQICHGIQQQSLLEVSCNCYAYHASCLCIYIELTSNSLSTFIKSVITQNYIFFCVVRDQSYPLCVCVDVLDREIMH